MLALGAAHCAAFGADGGVGHGVACSASGAGDNHNLPCMIPRPARYKTAAPPQPEIARFFHIGSTIAASQALAVGAIFPHLPTGDGASA